MTGGWRDMSTAPRDGTVVEVMWLERESWDIAAEEERKLPAYWGWHWDDDDVAGWRPQGARDNHLLAEPVGWRPLDLPEGWRSIESAPKDGTVVEGLWRGWERDSVARLRWSRHGYWVIPGSLEDRPEPAGWRPLGGTP